MRNSHFSLILLICCLELLPTSRANGQRLDDIEVRLEVSNGSLKSVFETIESQTELLFAYPPEKVNAYSGIWLPEAVYTVKEVLDLILEGTPLRYRRSKNHIVIMFVRKRGKWKDRKLPENYFQDDNEFL